MRSAMSTWRVCWSTPPSPWARATGSSPNACRSSGVVVVNKVDKASPDQVIEQLARAAAQLDLSEFFPVSALEGDGVEALVEHLIARLPEGPQYYPDDMVTDVPDAFWVAELVREQLLAVTHDELPHSIATRVDRVGVAVHPGRDPRRARLAEGDRDRQEGQRAQTDRHRRA